MTAKPRFVCARALMGVVCATAGAHAAGEQRAIPTRDQIDVKYTWDLSTMYPDAAAWEADYGKVDRARIILAKCKGTLAQSPQHLHDVLKLVFETRATMERLAVYARQLLDQEMSVSASQTLADRASDLETKFSEAVSWLEPEILALSEESIRSWMEADKELAVYSQYVKNLFRKKKHILGDREEQLLAMAGRVTEVPGNAFSLLTNAELPFPMVEDENGNQIQLSSGRYNVLRESPDRRVRKDAFMGLMKAYGDFKATLASTLNGAVQRDIYMAKARGFDSALEAALFPDNIPVSVYHNLLSTVHKHLDSLHRYAAIRKKALGLDEVHIYDLYVPLAGGVEKEVKYDDAVRTVLEALEPLGGEYLEPMRKGFESRWIDVYETKDKRSGAYSWGAYLTQPYVLLNYNNRYDDMSTLAHEMGHSMHSLFTRKNQPMVYGDYSTFVAEVASTFNEVLLNDYMMKQAKDPKEKLSLVFQELENIRNTVYRQTMFGEFELGIHEAAERGEALTAEFMGKLYMDTIRKFWGPDLTVDPQTAAYPLRIPHFYRGFYVYQYATSYSAAYSLAKDVMSGDKQAVQAYLGFLKSGSSDDPIEILKRAGVDMTTPKPIEDALERFASLLDELERLLQEVKKSS